MNQRFYLNKIGDQINELVDFSRANPWKSDVSLSLIRRYLTDLITSPRQILDFHDSAGRAFVGVLLDKVNNLANDACLEILGFRPDLDRRLVVENLVLHAKQIKPEGYSGFQVAILEAARIPLQVLTNLGLTHYYDTYDMRRSTLKESLSARHEEIVQATVADVGEVYGVLCDAFSKNPEISIPDQKLWASNFLKSSESYYYLWKEKGRIIGFAHLILSKEQGDCEIRTIGVLPAHRGKGVGRSLINHCLNQSFNLGFKSCHLTVAVTNERALDLYLKAGFETIQKTACYRVIE